MNISHCFIKKNHLAIVMLLAGEEDEETERKSRRDMAAVQEKQKELSEAGADESERAKELAFYSSKSMRSCRQN